jgi:hypothetical protein
MRSFPGKAISAEALRLILPLLLRLATVDFFGIDDFRDRVEVVLGFDVLRDRVEEDHAHTSPVRCSHAYRRESNLSPK